MSDQPRFAQELRTPRAAGIAGVVFAALLGIIIALSRRASAAKAQDPVTWITTASARHDVHIALTLVPFAGIAFLWFIGVIRSRLGAREDKLFATVFLGSGLLFVAMLFSAAAIRGALLEAYPLKGPVSVNTVQVMDALASTLLNTFGARMAAVFVLSVTTIGLRTRLFPRWLTVVGVVAALVLLLSPTVRQWTILLFPGWVLLLSLHVLFVSFREPELLAGGDSA